MEEDLIAFIQKEFVTDDSTTIDSNTKLVSTGLIDSLSIVSLLVFIEKRFHKTIPQSKFNVESFDTVGMIVKIINETQD